MFAQLGRWLGAADLYSDGVQLLRYGRGVDNTRLLREVGYEPRFDAEGTVLDFVKRSAASRRLLNLPTPAALADRLVGPR
jgi:hypothetical protein